MNLVVTSLANTSWGMYQKQQRAFEDRYQAKQIGPFKYLAVFDGHGGTAQRAFFSSNNVTTEKQRSDYFYQGQIASHIADFATNSLHNVLAREFSTIDINDAQEVSSAISRSFITFDQNARLAGALYGCTCTMLLIDNTHHRIYQVNLGDSRSMIFDEHGILLSSTVDHVPENIEEQQRIELAGGEVINDRVQGVLAVSRAFGDYSLKTNNDILYDPINGCVSSVPSITVIDTTGTDRLYYLLTSDAPYEMGRFTDNDLIVMMCRLLRSTDSYEGIAKKLVNNIVQWTTDDITIVVGLC